MASPQMQTDCVMIYRMCVCARCYASEKRMKTAIGRQIRRRQKEGDLHAQIDYHLYQRVHSKSEQKERKNEIKWMNTSHEIAKTSLTPILIMIEKRQFLIR